MTSNSQAAHGWGKDEYANKPTNHSPTPPFHTLFQDLFVPLNENKKRPGAANHARRKVGPDGPIRHTPHEARRIIIEKFFANWREKVGNDIYPAMRLIIPDKDRDRAMYGLKEKVLGKILIKVMKINKESEDARNLSNWKLPGTTMASRMAGDFAGRCFEVISKRPVRTEPGDMSIAEVNERLDALSLEGKEEKQMVIFEEFYANMNPEELLWLIRIVLRQMKLGATERTIFDIWHPDAEALFNISSSLKRVCWELWNPKTRLENDERGIALMQCFQPQLAQFQMRSFDQMVAKLSPTPKDAEFWIEEKLDGERMQMHMVSDPKMPGGKRFAFWSRKAKDYTYLYGKGYEDQAGALTRKLKGAFDEGVENLVLDGEMITWDQKQDAMVAFGTLKSAALSEQRNPYNDKDDGQIPFYKVFDILLLNGRPLTSYTLRDRRRALQASIVKPVHRRLEIHPHTVATTAAEIEPLLRKVVSESSEGLVLKNPRSMYRLNSRNDDWLKVKPEYMTEYGESLDLIVIGGYFGSGRRGGHLSSFLCGLIVAGKDVPPETHEMKTYSFCKVGGGLSAADYAAIRHNTDGKWKTWDAKKPPTEFIELGGGASQFQKPDQWILPSDSVVVAVKAASVGASEEYRMGLTLRFPRFQKLRTDKDWTSALTVQGFLDLKSNVDAEEREKKAFQVDDMRRKRQRVTRRKELAISGAEALPGEKALISRSDKNGIKIFEGLTFYVLSECVSPSISKAALEQTITSHGGAIRQVHNAAPRTICIADKRVVKVASLQKSADVDIIRPGWILDCIAQSEADIERGVDVDWGRYLLPLEERHVFSRGGHSTIEDGACDGFGDSFARDVDEKSLNVLMDKIKLDHKQPGYDFDEEEEEEDLLGLETSPLKSKGFTMRNLHIALSVPDTASAGTEVIEAKNKIRFAGGTVLDLDDTDVTHVLVIPDSEGEKRVYSSARIKALKTSLAERRRVPRVVKVEWLEKCWGEGTRVDEEEFAL